MTLIEFANLHPVVACFAIAGAVAAFFLWLAFPNDSWPFDS